MTEYYVQDSGKFSTPRLNSLKEAKKRFDCLCEQFPKIKFKLIRRTVTEEIVCESEDVRQARFDFVQ